MDAAPIDERIVDQAIGWLVRLQSGTASAADETACRQWRTAHPDHERAWQRLAGFSRRVHALPAQLAHATLEETQQRKAAQAGRRRTVLKSLALFGAAGVLGWQARDSGPWHRLAAQHATAVGERRRLQLADGGTLLLNTDTAVDVRYAAGERRIVLRRGEILIETMPDPAARPFFVDTPHGRLQALGTVFSVRLDGGGAGVATLRVRQGTVALRHADVGDVRVDAGRQLLFGPGLGGREPAPQPADADAEAWRDGLLVARRMPLAGFLAELGRYRPGVLRCDPEVAAMEISGVFSLDDTGHALQSLAQVFPLRIEQRTRYWVTVRGA
ncbi:FecR domain-containing protein [Pseudothauera nasutitermitis]|nr:FecR domain-containing protein [Pseudothauera nasutitermitis]